MYSSRRAIQIRRGCHWEKESLLLEIMLVHNPTIERSKSDDSFYFIHIDIALLARKDISANEKSKLRLYSTGTIVVQYVRIVEKKTQNGHSRIRDLLLLDS